jgi:hypothetical protein
VFNIAGALPYSLAPALAPGILALGSHPALYAVASLCALVAAACIMPVRGRAIATAPRSYARCHTPTRVSWTWCETRSVRLSLVPGPPRGRSCLEGSGTACPRGRS